MLPGLITFPGFLRLQWVTPILPSLGVPCTWDITVPFSLHPPQIRPRKPQYYLSSTVIREASLQHRMPGWNPRTTALELCDFGQIASFCYTLVFSSIK